MTREEFNTLFESCRKNCMPADQEQVAARLAAYSDGKGNINPMALALFAYTEGMRYTDAMLYQVLSKALDVPEKDD